MDPQVPQLDKVRLATLDDLPRIAIVAAAGFFYSPVFQYQRPHYEAYPEDTIASYFFEYEAAMHDPNAVVLVAEDIQDPQELDKAYRALHDITLSTCPPTPGKTVITGVSSITLTPGSIWSGRLQPTDLVQKSPCETPLQRDQCSRGGELYSKATAAAKTKYLAHRMKLATLAVHPAYWRRGHGSNLTKWCTTLADIEGVSVGVSAAKMGVPVFAKAGFMEQERVQIAAYQLPRDSVVSLGGGKQPDQIEAIELWIGIRQPVGTISTTAMLPLPKPAGTQTTPWTFWRAWNRFIGPEC
ncbi:uncharacterized protein BDZ99DRAFT_463759 [Mytilinidion resinicola]|uniref:N-acetyltransferase domain-containing protein n=1 Tax=Mytilinidion resinicola TaxID=574789 RepID=A0A6A6YJC0_9PEZI|nr:uncharacterized protein BDZ99DRAFT_463759 [Mytilinidion resinicola]KAF2808901.1 hypothetical protein BDZ99DRAFT_463759 [Mytilinidion resinicola]